MRTPDSSNPKSNPRREMGRIGWIGPDFRRMKRHFNRGLGSRRNLVKALLIRRLWVQLPRGAPRREPRRPVLRDSWFTEWSRRSSRLTARLLAPSDQAPHRYTGVRPPRSWTRLAEARIRPANCVSVAL